MSPHVFTEQSTPQNVFLSAVTALEQGHTNESIQQFESLVDQGFLSASLAFNRGLAYAHRARSTQAVSGDWGRAVHAFEEVLRYNPHDHEAQNMLDEMRKAIATRHIQASGRAVATTSPPMWRALVTAASGDVWVVCTLISSCLLACALAVRPYVNRNLRLIASTCSIVGFVCAVIGASLGLGSRYLRTHIREAVIVVPQATATVESNRSSLELTEGTRVDVLEERTSASRIRTDQGEGWVAREALRMLPTYRP